MMETSSFLRDFSAESNPLDTLSVEGTRTEPSYVQSALAVPVRDYSYWQSEVMRAYGLHYATPTSDALAYHTTMLLEGQETISDVVEQARLGMGTVGGYTRAARDAVVIGYSAFNIEPSEEQIAYLAPMWDRGEINASNINEQARLHIGAKPVETFADNIGLDYVPVLNANVGVSPETGGLDIFPTMRPLDFPVIRNDYDFVAPNAVTAAVSPQPTIVLSRNAKIAIVALIVYFLVS